MQLAHHRAEIEATGVQSIRKARKFITKTPRAPQERKPRPTIILRKALSHAKAANRPGVSEAAVTANNNEALASLHQLIALLVRDGADINDVSIVVAKSTMQQHRRAA